jgi:phenylacetate-coenzyme A ligase PaaK-like adenylate-forming protein
MTAGAVSAPHVSVPARMSAELTRRLGQYTARLGWDANELAAHQRERLRVLLAHAAEHSRFHAPRLRGLDVSRFEVGDLARLPVMTKS